MNERVNWKVTDLRQIWDYNFGNNQRGICPYRFCEFKQSPMEKNNYGNHSKISWVVDHKKPISKGGQNYLNNLQPMHNYCNSVKSDD